MTAIIEPVPLTFKLLHDPENFVPFKVCGSRLLYMPRSCRVCSINGKTCSIGAWGLSGVSKMKAMVVARFHICSLIPPEAESLGDEDLHFSGGNDVCVDPQLPTLNPETRKP